MNAAKRHKPLLCLLWRYSRRFRFDMGLLDFGKKVFARTRKDANSSDENRMNVAFVLLSHPQLPNPDDVVKSFPSFIPEGPSLRCREGGEPADSECLLFDIAPDSGAIVMLMPTAVPNNEADDAAQFSISALGTGWIVPPHQAHLIVTFQSPSPKLESLLMFTALVAAVVDVSPSVGVYWGEAGATHDPKFFVAAAQPGTIESQIVLWNGVSVASEPDGRISLLSLGMKQLDLPELWLIAPKEKETLGWFFDLLGYVATRREALPDGDTIGRTAEEKIPVRYVKSPIEGSTKVCRIEVK